MNYNSGQPVWKRLRDGGANVASPGPTIASDVVGAEFPGVSEAATALALVETEFLDAFDAMGAQEEEEFVSTADKDKETGKGVRAFNARREARVTFAERVEVARPEAIAECDIVEAEGASAMLELLDALEVEADKVGRAQYIRAAAKDTNPSSRYSVLPPTFRRPGGELISQLRAALGRIGQADYYVLPGDQFERYVRGEAALDVFGSEVPVGLGANRVRRSYNPSTFRPVSINSEGGVA